MNKPISGIIEKARWYAIECHESVNHLYDGRRYSVHLSMVYQTAMNFIHLVPVEMHEDVLAACWAHDVIEDTRQTYNDVKSVLGEKVADIVFALTNDKGKTRKERAGENYYKGIRSTPGATFVKLCDRIANMMYSTEKGSDMALKYSSELADFKHQLYTPELQELWDKLESINNKIQNPTEELK